MKNAFNSGMRGGEKPPEKKAPKKNVRRITIEPAKDGGRIVRVERHPPKPTKGKDGVPTAQPWPDESPSVHGSHEEAMNHVRELGNQMATPGEYQGSED